MTITLQEAKDIIARWELDGVPVALGYCLAKGSGHTRMGYCHVELDGDEMWARTPDGTSAQVCVSLQSSTFSYTEGAELRVSLQQDGYTRQADAVSSLAVYLVATNTETGAKLCLVERFHA